MLASKKSSFLIDDILCSPRSRLATETGSGPISGPGLGIFRNTHSNVSDPHNVLTGPLCPLQGSLEGHFLNPGALKSYLLNDHLFIQQSKCHCTIAHRNPITLDKL